MEKHTLSFTTPEFNAVLAGLRLITIVTEQAPTDKRCADLLEFVQPILDDGEVGLFSAQIDDLADRINGDDEPDAVCPDCGGQRCSPGCPSLL